MAKISVNRILQSMERYIQWYGGSVNAYGMEKDDVCQEIRIKVAKSVKEYKKKRGSNNSYFVRVIKNATGDIVRRTARRRERERLAMVDVKTVMDYDSPDTMLEKKDTATVAKGIAGTSASALKPQSRKIFKMLLAGARLKDVADSLGISKSFVHHVKKREIQPLVRTLLIGAGFRWRALRCQA